MCLVSKWRFPKKAKEDIVCYKQMVKKGDFYYAPFYKTNPVDITKPYKAKGSSFTCRFIKSWIKEGGYIHVFKDKPTCVLPDMAIFECIIPKNTKYHQSRDDVELCTKEIRFKQLVEYISYEDFIRYLDTRRKYRR